MKKVRDEAKVRSRPPSSPSSDARNWDPAEIGVYVIVKGGAALSLTAKCERVYSDSRANADEESGRLRDGAATLKRSH